MNKEFLLHTHIIKRHAAYFPHVIIFHVPNQTRDATEAFFNKQLGVRAGVTDLVILWTHNYPIEELKSLGRFARMHCGVVEVKVDARITTAQNKFLSAVAGLGGNQGVIYSWQQYYKLLCSWGIKPMQICTIFDEPDYRDWSQKRDDAIDAFRP